MKPYHVRHGSMITFLFFLHPLSLTFFLQSPPPLSRPPSPSPLSLPLPLSISLLLPLTSFLQSFIARVGCGIRLECPQRAAERASVLLGRYPNPLLQVLGKSWQCVWLQRHHNRYVCLFYFYIIFIYLFHFTFILLVSISILLLIFLF